MRGDIAVSFDGTEGYKGQPYLRRPAASQMPPQGRPAPPPPPQSSHYGPGPGPGLPFMTFDLASGSGSGSSAPPPYGYGSGDGGGFASFEDEPPLLEELGINMTQITQKMLSVLNPFTMNPGLHEDPDLSGPFLLCMAFGLAQLLSGKVYFGVILGWTSVASVFLYMVYNLLAGRHGNLDLYRCVSLVGYSLVPLVLFSAVGIFVPNGSVVRFGMAAATVLWCTRVCTTLMVFLIPHADEHRALIAYPCALIYTAFSLLVLF